MNNFPYGLDRFCRDLLVVGAEGGINYWADVLWAGGEGVSIWRTDTPVVPTVDTTAIQLEHESLDGDMVVTIVTTEMLEASIRQIVADGYPNTHPASDCGMLRHQLQTAGIEEDFDASTADYIIQHAIFGQLVYG